DLQPLYKEILTHVPPPEVDTAAPLQMLVVSLISDAYVGRIAVGKVIAGTIKKGQRVALMKRDGSRVDDTVVQLQEFDRRGRGDEFVVSGRGMLHLGILLENMRREGLELAVGKPKVIFKHANGEKLEPIEYLVVETPGDAVGPVMQLVLGRRGECVKMDARDSGTHLEFTIPARGLIGLRTRLLNATAGRAIMHHNFHDYQPYKGDIPARIN